MLDCHAANIQVAHLQVIVSSDVFDELQHEWAPLDDPVFQVTPTSFHNQATDHYASLGCPAISPGTFWDTYKTLLACFRQNPVDLTFDEEFNLANLAVHDDVDLLQGLRQLQIGDEVVGDGVVLQEDYDAAEFTSDEEAVDTNGTDIYAADFTDNE